MLLSMSSHHVMIINHTGKSRRRFNKTVTNSIPYSVATTEQLKNYTIEIIEEIVYVDRFTDIWILNLRWWVYFILIILVFLLCMVLNYIVKKYNENRLEDRFQRLHEKRSLMTTMHAPYISLDFKKNLEEFKEKEKKHESIPDFPISMIYTKEDNAKIDERKRAVTASAVKILDEIDEVTGEAIDRSLLNTLYSNMNFIQYSPDVSNARVTDDPNQTKAEVSDVGNVNLDRNNSTKNKIKEKTEKNSLKEFLYINNEDRRDSNPLSISNTTGEKINDLASKEMLVIESSSVPKLQSLGNIYSDVSKLTGEGVLCVGPNINGPTAVRKEDKGDISKIKYPVPDLQCDNSLNDVQKEKEKLVQDNTDAKIPNDNIGASGSHSK